MNQQKRQNYLEIFEVHFSMIMFYILFFNLIYIMVSFYIKFVSRFNWMIYLNPLMYLFYLKVSHKVLILESRTDKLSLILFLFSLVLFNISLFLIFFETSIIEAIIVLILTFLVFIFSGINIFKKP